MNRSALFVAYNAARGLAAKGYFDMDRLNRALGLAQRKEPRPYNTTVNDCDCPDNLCRPSVVCKHRLAKMLQEMCSVRLV